MSSRIVWKVCSSEGVSVFWMFLRVGWEVRVPPTVRGGWGGKSGSKRARTLSWVM